MANSETTKELRISDPQAKVFLTVTIGNAQIGGTLVKWEDAEGHIGKGIINNLFLGLGSETTGKTLELYTNILDVNPSTNGVVATYYLHNCEPATFTLSDKVENEGDVFSFKTKVTFI